MEDYEGKVRLVIKDYPYKYRDYAFISAEASLAARDQGKFWEMHDILLEKSPKLDRESLIRYAKEIGLDMKKFKESLDRMKHKERIDRDVKLAQDFDIYNTPTFFINGRKVIGNRSYEYLKKIIEEELENAKK
jgi:protein-disulfide isomerase